MQELFELAKTECWVGQHLTALRARCYDNRTPLVRGYQR